MFFDYYAACCAEAGRKIPLNKRLLISHVIPSELGCKEAVSGKRGNTTAISKLTSDLHIAVMALNQSIAQGMAPDKDASIMSDWVQGMLKFLSPNTKLADARDLSDRMFSRESPISEEDWRLLGDLYYEDSQNPHRGIAHANIFLKADEVGLREDMIIVLNLLPSEKTKYPISGSLFPVKDFQKAKASLSSERIVDHVDGEGELKRNHVHGSIKFYITPDGEVILDTLAFNTLERNEALMKQAYAKIRAYVHYAVASEVSADYEIAPPKQFRQANTSPTPSAPHIDHIPHPPRRVTLVKTPDEAKRIYDSLMPAGRIEHTRLLKEGWTPSETAYEISRTPKYNPQNISLRAAIIDLEARDVKLVEIDGGGSYPVFLREFERIKAENQVKGKVEVRCQTFVRRTVKDEEVAQRAAVLNTAELAELGKEED